MNDLLTIILQNITTKPDAVQISMEQEGDVEVYTIKVDPDDVGRVIGKSGKIIRAIRSLAHVSAVQQQKRVRVHLDDGGAENQPAPQTEINQAATQVTEGEVKPEAMETPEVVPAEPMPEVAPEVAPEETEEAPEAVESTPKVESAKEAPAKEAPAKEDTPVEDLLPEEPEK